MSKQIRDIKLIKASLKGSQQAYRSLYEHYRQSLFMVCLRYAKDRSTAQDYLQEAFINIFKNLQQFDDTKGVFESWAKRIAINVCLSNIRKQSLYSVNITRAEQMASLEVDALSQLSLQEMLKLVQGLPYGYRTVFNMYVIDGYAHKEIAAELNISVSTSKSQLMKARNLLQRRISINQRVLNQDHG